MFCKKCGAQMSETAKFCPKCGNQRIGEQETTKKIVEDNTIKFKLKPQFNMPYQLINAILGGLGILLVIVCSFESFAILVDFPIVSLSIMAIYIVINLIFGKMQYKNLEYNFYTTKVEYIDGFLNKEQKELKYKYVREVTMSQNILERLCNIGTIKVFTNASSGYSSSSSHNSMRGRNGLFIHCIENVEEQYKIIKQIIDDGTQDE